MISCKALEVSNDPKARMGAFGDADYNMLWTCRADPRFQYWIRVPQSYMTDENRKDYKLIVVIHGTGCEVDRYLLAAVPRLEELHAIVLAPVFPSGLFYKNDFNSYKLLACDGLRYDEILLQMIEEIKDRYDGINTEKFCICGHSGGGQFTNRFLLVHPDRLLAASISAPGRPTFIDDTQDYFWGTKNMKEHFGHDVDVEALKKVHIQMVIGSEDTKYIGESPYGTTRIERLHSLKKNFEENGLNVEMNILDGVDHCTASGDGKRMNAFMDFFQKLF